MYKMDLALNNLQRLICHKTKPNQTTATNVLIYDSKSSEGEALSLEQWGKSSTLSVQLLLSTLSHEVVAPDRLIYMSPNILFNDLNSEQTSDLC